MNTRGNALERKYPHWMSALPEMESLSLVWGVSQNVVFLSKVVTQEELMALWKRLKGRHVVISHPWNQSVSPSKGIFKMFHFVSNRVEFELTNLVYWKFIPDVITHNSVEGNLNEKVSTRLKIELLEVPSFEDLVKKDMITAEELTEAFNDHIQSGENLKTNIIISTLDKTHLFQWEILRLIEIVQKWMTTISWWYQWEKYRSECQKIINHLKGLVKGK